MRKIIVTGATSMIGVALIESVLKDNLIDRIYAVIRQNTQKKYRLPQDQRIRIISCDMENYRVLPELISEPCDVFYHLAWPRTETYMEDYEDIYLKSQNIQVIIEVVNTAVKLGCKKFIGAGSQSEYGVLNKDKISPEDICNPVRVDGVLHLAAGQLAQIIAKKLEISCIWMRIFSVYGKYDRDNSMINSTISKLQSGERCLFTKAEQKWDYLEAEDIGEAFYLVGKNVSGIHTYCVGKGESRPLYEYIKIIRDIVAPNSELGIGELPYPNNPIMNLCADISSLQRDTGWVPRINFEEGIRKLIDYSNKKEDKQFGKFNQSIESS